MTNANKWLDLTDMKMTMDPEETRQMALAVARRQELRCIQQLNEETKLLEAMNRNRTAKQVQHLHQYGPPFNLPTFFCGMFCGAGLLMAALLIIF